MTKNPSPVLLDRLSHSLQGHGVRLKRAQLLETAAYAFGCRSSNEFAAALKAGDVAPPPVVPIGRIALPNGEAVLVVTDPLANSAYAIDEAFVEQVVAEERRETIGVTPYGHLVDLSGLPDVAMADLGSVAAPANAPLTGLADAVRAAISRIDGYTAEDHEADVVGQAENGLSRALEAALSGNALDCSHELFTASLLLTSIRHDDAERHLEWTQHAIRAAGAIAGAGAPETDRALATVVRGLLVLVDEEIEKRKEGGDPLAWRDLQHASDAAHDALRGAPAAPGDGDPSSLRVSRDDLEQVLGAADSWAEDLESGLADGTYEDDAGIDDVRASMRTLRLRLAMEAPTPLAPEPAAKPGTVTIHVGRISHKHGEDVHVALTRPDLARQLAEYCREQWSEVSDWDDVPANPDGMTDQEVVDAYFEAMSNHEGREYIDTSEETVAVPTGHPLAVAAVPAGQCRRCDSGLVFGMCSDDTCPFHDVPQDDPRGWEGHPEHRADTTARTGSATPAASPEAIDRASELAAILQDGADSDIWYEAEDFGDDDEEDPDRIAENTIERTQDAMREAAALLRALRPTTLPDGRVLVAGVRVDPARAAASVTPPDPDRVVFVTDAEGDDTGQLTRAMSIAMGLSYDADGDGDYHPLTSNERGLLHAGETLNAHLSVPVRCGFAALWRGAKWIAPEAEFSWDDDQEGPDGRARALSGARAWIKEIRADVEALGGAVHLFEGATDSTHEVSVLLPFDVAAEADRIQDWTAALSWLLSTGAERAERPTVSCEYTAQRAVGRNGGFVTSVDPAGDTVWNGTFDALRWGTRAAIAVLDGSGDADDYARSPLAPAWVREWSDRHPFEVQVVGLAEALRIAL